MDEHALRELIEDVEAGRLSRRAWLQLMIRVGVTAPMAARMLASSGIARAQSKGPAFTPTRRGGGGTLRLLNWQAPTMLNPHLSTGLKDTTAARLFHEPLASFDAEGNLVPILAADIPSVDNGGLAKDGTWVIWNLKKGVTWHDGRPFSADDVVFNWQYSADPATAATSVGLYRDLKRVEKLHDHAVKVVFPKPTPFWADPFCGNAGMLIPRHLFEPYHGSKSREAPSNLRPVGTGPYRVVDFKPGDMVRAEINSSYRVVNRPFFDAVELKGGGDAVSTARAVLQTGEYDLAFGLQVEDEILRRLEQVGKGRLIITPSSAVEHIQCNFADPWKEVDGERSNVKAPHPLLTDAAVRAALGLLVDRATIQEQIYGRLGQATANFLNMPARFVSANTAWEFSVDKANHVLESAGWKRGGDGVRAKDGKRLKLLYQTATNAPRQKVQAIIKQACAKAGIEIELKAVVASVFFSSDPANPDTYRHFYADLQQYNTRLGRPDPKLFMEQYTSWRIASRENKWSGSNTTRWRNEEYDRLWKTADTEMDPVKRAAMFIRMNDLIVQNVAVIPLFRWNEAVAASTSLQGISPSPWEGYLWTVASWVRQLAAPRTGA
ncbi:MAG: peptide ABC transporter substrate-binding protein [Candidatus Rokuibacteriota bacterium]|nr:MAG: peptide ABC transporter substrate-binding protein [Candidatus Rokubacteria bacterium]